MLWTRYWLGFKPLLLTDSLLSSTTKTVLDGSADSSSQSPQPEEPPQLPVFIEEPRDTYVVKNRPATLSCSVEHATKVYFKCNDDWVGTNHHSLRQYTRPGTGTCICIYSTYVFRYNCSNDKIKIICTTLTIFTT